MRTVQPRHARRAHTLRMAATDHGPPDTLVGMARGRSFLRGVTRTMAIFLRVEYLSGDFAAVAAVEVEEQT